MSMKWEAVHEAASRRFLDADDFLILLFSGGTLLCAFLQRLFLEELQSGQHLVEFNVGEMFAAAAIVAMVFDARGRMASLSRGDFTALILSSLSWFIPEQHAIYLAMTGAGGWMLLKRPHDRLLVGVGQMWLALSIYELWGKLIFKCVYQLVEVFEVSLIFHMGRIFFKGLEVQGANLAVRPDWSIVILDGCSSFHNLSLAALIWLSILKLANRSVNAGALYALLMSAGMVVVINIGRILAMLPSSEAYAFWHDGSGSSYSALASVLASVLPILLYVEKPYPWRANPR